MSRLIDADAIYPWYMDAFDFDPNEVRFSMNDIRDNLDNIPTHPTPSNTLGALDTEQSTLLTNDDKETIRIHLSAIKEGLCNQRRWNEAKEYEELITRLLSTPSVKPRKGKWHGKGDSEGFGIFICDNCGKFAMMEYDFCPNCGSYNGGEQTE